MIDDTDLSGRGATKLAACELTLKRNFSVMSLGSVEVQRI